MSILTGQPITFGTTLARKAILEPAFAKPLMKLMFSVWPDPIKTDEQIAFLGRMSKVTRKESAGAPVDKQIPLTEKTWTPVEVEMWIKQKAADLKKMFLVHGLGLGIERFKLDKAVMGDDPEKFWDGFVADLMQDAAYEDLLRMLFLSSTAITAANLTNGEDDVEYYDQINGVWQQVIADGSMKKVSVTENALADVDAQLAGFTEEDSYTYLKAMVNKGDSRLTSDPSAYILLTKPWYDAYIGFLENNRNLESSWKTLQDGMVVPSFRGRPILEGDFLSRNIEADFLVGGKYDKPFRALFTTSENMKVGFDSEAAASQFESYYDWKPKEMHMRGNYMLDVKVMRSYLAVAAY